VRGVGLGYLGMHQLGVARALDGLVPRVLGIRDGLLYEEWLPPHRRIGASAPLAAGAAAYVAARRQRLPVDRDATPGLAGQRPVWEVAGLLLGGAFGRAAPVARVTLVDPAMRRLLEVATPSLIDGHTAPEHWYAEASGRPVKAGFSDRTYWNLGLSCCDAAFDLAGVGAFDEDGTLAGQVREAWTRETGEDVAAERWLLYELAHLWGRRQADPAQEAAVRHASARAVQRYFAEILLADLARSADGPLVALDIDGVLETDVLGFPTLTRAGGTALRALIAHGYRPVPVTGRGVTEVRDRCRSYGLTAGVAEYGSAVYVQDGARAFSLVDDRHAAALRRLRAVLLERDGVRLDPAHRHSVRAYRLRRGSPAPLTATEAAECAAAAGGGRTIHVIHGDGQTDFIAAGIDKGRGLWSLRDALDGAGRGPADSGRRIALAVGDTVTDRPMLVLAERSAAPAHAAAETLVPGTTRVPRAYQAGLALAVAQLLGHAPGGCARCRPAPATPERRLLLDLFSISEGGRRGLPRGAMTAAGGALRLRGRR
jgi:hydroxymethylpyrimidine pyrophosphatase-like HAD family hydrolase